MIKQILNKFPRKKSSKSGSNGTTKMQTVTSKTAPVVASDVPLQASGSGDLLDPLSRNGVSTDNNHQSLSSSSSSMTTTTTEVGSPDDGSLPSGSGSFELLPLLRDVPVGERQDLFLRKLSLCSIVVNYPHLTENSIAAKQQTLQEIGECLASGGIKFTEPIIEGLVAMVSANAFRTLPPPSRRSLGLEGFDHEDEEPFLDPTWCHLQHVYETLLRFILSGEIDGKLAKRYIDHSFILRLLDLFNSEDHREREYLKIILHRIYGKFMVHRPFIRKAINNVFYHFIYETERHNGILELLEILGTVINGFALPLKEEHKLFLARALLPLHKPRSLPLYHQQLSFCVTQFVEKDSKLAVTVVRGLLKYWPVTSSQKEVLFLSELEEVLESTQPEEFQCFMVPLFRQVGRCLSSPHFQVAERALFLWNIERVVDLVSRNREVIFPLVLPALEQSNRSHWNTMVLGLSASARQMFCEMDPHLFHDCQRKSQEAEAEDGARQDRRGCNWRRLEAAASTNHVVGEAVLVNPLR